MRAGEKKEVFMAEYMYETHLHTSEASACGKLTGAEQADLYKELGYTGIIVTDHFFNGNSAIARDLPWEERIHRYCAGYRNAKKRGDEIGLQVYLGLETAFTGQEFLLYGLSEEWLSEQEDMLSWSPAEQFRRVTEAGALWFRRIRTGRHLISRRRCCTRSAARPLRLQMQRMRQEVAILMRRRRDMPESMEFTEPVVRMHMEGCSCVAE